MLHIRRKALILGLFLMIAVYPYDTWYFENVMSVSLTVYFGILIDETFSAIKRGPKITYVLSTGQALAEAIAQSFRIAGCIMENLIVIIYYNIITYMCEREWRHWVLFSGSVS